MERRYRRGRESRNAKQSNRNDTTPVARNLKQKEELPDLLCMPEDADFNFLIGDNTIGNEIIAKISEFAFRHHQKKGKDYKNTPLCLLYAVGQICPQGKGYSKNHSRRKDLKNLAAQRDNVALVKKILKDHYE